MRTILLAMAILLVPATRAPAQVNIQIGWPGVQIGVQMPSFPHLVRVPGYPVYYDDRGSANYFFYDGLYWVYWGDNWYSSSWYDGPWEAVGPEYVPLYVLRVPVRYYRQPPQYFRGWRADAPPRWGDHWGHRWESQRSGWNRWSRNSVPAPAPLPVYQQQYSGDRYPRTVEQERTIRTQHYSYQPREAVSRQRLTPPLVNVREGRPAPQQQVRESRPAPQQYTRESRPAPQQQIHENRSAPQQQARENRPPPPQQQVRESRPAPPPQQQQARENRPAPPPPQQAHGNGPAPQQAHEQKARPQQGKGQENKDKEHGHDKGDR